MIDRITSVAKTEWFGLAKLGAALLAATVWYLTDGSAGVVALYLILIPALISVAAGKLPFRRTPFDLALAVFLVTAVVGATISYDPVSGWRKFWLIVGAIGLFYAIVEQSRRNLTLLRIALALFAPTVSLYFLLTHDFEALPSKIGFLNDFLVTWSAQSRFLNLHDLHPNVAGGLMATTSPFLIALMGPFLENLRRRTHANLVPAAASLLGIVIVAVGLAAASSRGALLALAIASVVSASGALIWRAFGDRRRSTLALLALAVIGGAVILSILLISPAIFSLILDLVPGPDRSGSRFELIQAGLTLIEDFPVVGAGLASFPGLYSHYVLSLPVYFLPHAHNMFIDITLEQGALGITSFLTVAATTVYLLASRPSRREDLGVKHLRWATALSLIVISAHALIDDIFYGSRSVLLIFIHPALAYVIQYPFGRMRRRDQSKILRNGLRVGLASIAVVTFLLLLLPPGGRVRWQVNRASLQLARSDLVSFPVGGWNDGSNMHLYQAPKEEFTRIVTSNPDIRTAQHRLGLISLVERDFDRAVEYLEAARQLDPAHGGIEKNLAYALVWSGKLEQSLPHLAHVPEAADELKVYSSWWVQQGEQELSGLASRALVLVGGD